MRLIRMIALVAALGTFMALPSVTTGTEGYNAYVACGYRTSKPAATECPKHGRIGAFFQSTAATVDYKTCVTFPNGQRQCTKTATAQQGTFYVVRITAGTRGTLTVRWKVNGVVVAKYSIQVV